MATYQLTLFYSTLHDAESDVRLFHREVVAKSGKDWLVLSKGEQLCAIGFASNESHDQLRGRFDRLGSDKCEFLLTQIQATVSAYLGKRKRDWLKSHLA